VKRREFIAGVSAAAAWPLAASAQQPPPVIGFLHVESSEAAAKSLALFRQGLAEAGDVEGRNVAIEYRLAHGERGRLAELAADLVSKQVNVIATPGSSIAALAAQKCKRLPNPWDSKSKSSSPPLIAILAQSLLTLPKGA